MRRDHAKSVGGEVVAEFRDVENGRKADRSGLTAALAECRGRRATLLIAKLDRLARSVAFISNLMEGKVDFVVADMPGVNRLTVHVLAAVAEHEREMILQRTKAALAMAKLRGTRLGNPRLPPAGRLAAAPAPIHARGRGPGGSSKGAGCRDVRGRGGGGTRGRSSLAGRLCPGATGGAGTRALRRKPLVAAVRGLRAALLHAA